MDRKRELELEVKSAEMCRDEALKRYSKAIDDCRRAVYARDVYSSIFDESDEKLFRARKALYYFEEDAE